MHALIVSFIIVPLICGTLLCVYSRPVEIKSIDRKLENIMSENYEITLPYEYTFVRGIIRTDGNSACEFLLLVNKYESYYMYSKKWQLSNRSDTESGIYINSLFKEVEEIRFTTEIEHQNRKAYLYFSDADENDMRYVFICWS